MATIVTRHLRAGFPVCGILVASLLFTLAGPVWAGFPTTVQEQATWLGDVYAAGLREHYPEGLSEQSVASTRGALITGLETLLKQPLSVEQLSDLTAWVGRSTAMGTYPPPDLELLRRRVNLLNIIELYLTRPSLSSDEGAELMGRILRQLGGLFDELRQALSTEFSDVPGAAEMAAGAVFWQAAIVAEEARSAVSPSAKRLLTDEEVANLRQQAQSLAAEARAAWACQQQRVLEVTGAADALAYQHAGSAMLAPAARFASGIQALYYRAPQVLTADEERAVWEYYHNLFLEDAAAQAAEGSEQ